MVPDGFTLVGWNTEDGLPQMTPRAITQTRNGYLWVGTFNGLARFDGVRFTAFTVNNTPELASDSITLLFEDSAGTLWIGTSEGGLVRYSNGAFSALHGPENFSRLTVNGICEDTSGTLWIGTSRGLCRIVNEKLTPFSLVGTPVVSVIRGVHEDLWIGTQNDIRRMNGDGSTDAPIASSRGVRFWFMDGSGKLWASYMEGNLGVVPAGAKIVRGSEPHARFKVDSVSPGKDGRLWMGTLSGVLYDLAVGQANPFVERATFTAGITAVYQDSNENVWLGLEGRGLWRMRKSPFITLDQTRGLPTPVTSICRDSEGSIWAGTWGKHLRIWNGEQFESIATPGVPPQVSTLLPARDGKLWFGTYGGRLARRLNTGEFEYEEVFGKHTRTLFQDRDGGIWAGKFLDGLFCLASDGRLQRYSERDGLSNDAVQAIAQDHAGGIWIGTAKGLNRIHEGKIQSFFRKDGLAGENVRALCVDSHGSIWIGSAGGGLSCWREGKLRFISMEQGLINNGIEQIIEDDRGCLWLGSDAGLMRVELRQLNDCLSGNISFVHCMVSRQEQGTLPGFGTGFQPSCFKAADGKLWFAAAAGIVVIDPATIQPASTPPSVYVEELRADKNVWRIAPGSKRTKVVPAGTQRLEFRYTGIDFEAPTLVTFRHKLEGFESEWVNAGKRREAVYTRIPPGEYRFRVSAANNQGIWNETGAVAAFVVEPFFWQTRAFQIAAPICGLLASGALVWVFVSQKHRRDLERLGRERALERERARIAQDMHDGLGASLVRISLLGERVERCLDQPEQAQEQIRKITATARDVMAEMDEIVWAVNPRNDTLDNFAGYLCQFAQEHFKDTPVACRVEVPAQLPIQALGAEVRHNLLLAVREAMNNIVKHSRGKSVRVAMDYAHPRLTIEIEDDGVGFEKTPRQGNGLANIRHRIETLGGNVEIQNLAQGTRVRLTLKIEEYGI
jgi:ligand-binding sensor domain-containing protein/signal transduction histidine kinase